MSEQMLWSVYVFRKGASDFSLEAVFNLQSDAIAFYEELEASKKWLAVQPFEESLVELIDKAVDSRLSPVQSVFEQLVETVDRQSKVLDEAIEDAKDTWY